MSTLDFAVASPNKKRRRIWRLEFLVVMENHEND